MANLNLPTKRKITQLFTALVYNADIKNYFKGTINQNPAKGLCVPGLNCYSCPGAIGSCPLGALQFSISQMSYKLPFYILGTFLILGGLFGRFICGFLCPFGLVQEILYKIPTPKLKKNKFTRKLSYTKFLILIIFVFILPYILSSPAFCKYICPSGTLGAGVPLVLIHGQFNDIIGFLFKWKISLMIIILIIAIFHYRIFCKYICPLGAIYALFNKYSIFGIVVDDNKCIDCGICVKVCKMDIHKVNDLECINCGDCISPCPTNAIHWKKLNYKGEKIDKKNII